jgi:flavin reductase (DIM6/NTAB) family NADH-FMN oxidoreductase RutF
MRQQWAQAIGRMTYGIYVLTTSHEETVNGMIASWVSMVSYEPPLVMVAVHPNRYSHRLLENGGHFALNVIANGQEDYLARFKGPDPGRKFDGIDWQRGQTGCPVLRDSLGAIECEVVHRYEPGNHTLFVGRIVQADAFGDGVPMCTLDYDGVYLGRD